MGIRHRRSFVPLKSMDAFLTVHHWRTSEQFLLVLVKATGSPHHGEFHPNPPEGFPKKKNTRKTWGLRSVCVYMIKKTCYNHVTDPIYPIFFGRLVFSTKNHYTWKEISELGAASNGTSHTHTPLNSSSPCLPKKHPQTHQTQHIFQKYVNTYCQLYGCFRKWWYPQIIHFNKDFHINHPFWGISPYFWFNTHIQLRLRKLTAGTRKIVAEFLFPYRIYETNGIFTYTLVDICGK